MSLSPVPALSSIAGVPAGLPSCLLRAVQCSIHMHDSSSGHYAWACLGQPRSNQDSPHNKQPDAYYLPLTSHAHFMRLLPAWTLAWFCGWGPGRLFVPGRLLGPQRNSDHGTRGPMNPGTGSSAPPGLRASRRGRLAFGSPCVVIAAKRARISCTADACIARTSGGLQAPSARGPVGQQRACVP